jgi:hypothetical protein
VLVTYLRSSSIGAYDWCPHSAWIGGNFGIRRDSLLKTDMGSCVHKALEILAQQKLAQQEKQAEFGDGELGCVWKTGSISPDDAVSLSYLHYSSPSKSPHIWTDVEERQCRKWVWDVLRYDGGLYNPSQMHVVIPEQYFDIEIRRPWAWYSYDLPGGQLQGFLRIKGTMDLIQRLDEKTIHYIDWKTGRRMNWNTKRAKSVAELQKEPQFLLYYFALRHLYPADDVIFTVFYVQDGGPHTLYFDDSSLEAAENMLRREYEKMRDDQAPTLVAPSWKCTKCSYSTQEFENTGQSVCEYFRNERVQLGMDRVFAKHGDRSLISEYQGGGGRSWQREDKDTSS